MSLKEYRIVNFVVIFNNSFNLPLYKYLLKNILSYKIIIFGNYFNNSIDKLSQNITHLELGRYFTQSLNILYKFKFITHLKIVSKICDINIFPESLKWLHTSNIYFDNIMINNLPANLLYLTIGNSNCNNLPCGLIYLKIMRAERYTYYALPMSLKYLDIAHDNNLVNYEVLTYNLPSCLVSLSIELYDVLNINNLPQNLCYLKIAFYGSTVPNILFPDSIQKLVIISGIDFNPLNFTKIILPSKLKYFDFYDSAYNAHSDNPNLHTMYNNIQLPNSIKIFGFNYFDKITTLKLPNKLKKFIIYNYYDDVKNNSCMTNDKYNIIIKKNPSINIKNVDYCDVFFNINYALTNIDDILSIINK